MNQTLFQSANRLMTSRSQDRSHITSSILASIEKLESEELLREDYLFNLTKEEYISTTCIFKW